MVKLPRYILLKIDILIKYWKKIKRSIYSHLAHHEPPPSNHERSTRGARTQLEFTARDYEFTSSRREWNAVSPLVNLWSRVYDFNGTQHKITQKVKVNVKCHQTLITSTVWVNKSSPSPPKKKLSAIFSLRLSIFLRCFADLLPVYIHTYLPILVDLS